MSDGSIQSAEEEVLQTFVLRARSAARVMDLVDAVMDCAPRIVGASVCGVFLQTPTGFKVHQIGAPEAFVTQYIAFTAVSVDPVHSSLATRHGVVRSNELFDDAEWRRHPFYRDLGAPFRLGAYMAGELVDAYAPRGAIGVARPCGSGAFSLGDAQRLHTICLHASVAFTRLTREDRAISLAYALSPRQQQLVQLVANGLTNDQIGRACGITTHAVKKALERLFVRINVSSRAELIATLGVRAGGP
jgi:DNA-binding CsgD family transcriptional regulator